MRAFAALTVLCRCLQLTQRVNLLANLLSCVLKVSHFFNKANVREIIVVVLAHIINTEPNNWFHSNSWVKDAKHVVNIAKLSHVYCVHSSFGFPASATATQTIE